MIEQEIIIIGGGPAGSTCAWKLRELGKTALILDKSKFPRNKLCAGWITPRVIKKLKIDISNYPHNLTIFPRLHFQIHGRHFSIKTTQYAIRRIEFDEWLLRRSGVPVIQHEVKNIVLENGYYVIDQKYRCRILVGASGTYCPVYQTFYKNEYPRLKEKLIVAMEAEFPYPVKDKNCYLWFYENNLPGYSWYVPKTDFLNIGIGGKFLHLQSRQETIKEHWDLLVNKLKNSSLIDDVEIAPRGYQYYLRHKQDTVPMENLYIIGDAAGLATIDMGEGIGPAVESGLRAACAIVSGKKFSLKSIPKYSIFQIILGKYFRIF
jgi:flavin-dependent dehydrogenase